MSGNEFSFASRIARAFRRSRALLSTSERFDRLAAQVSEAEERLKTQMAETVQAMGTDIKCELTAQLAFSFHDLAQRTATLESRQSESHDQLRRHIAELEARLNASGNEKPGQPPKS